MSTAAHYARSAAKVVAATGAATSKEAVEAFIRTLPISQWGTVAAAWNAYCAFIAATRDPHASAPDSPAPQAVSQARRGPAPDPPPFPLEVAKALFALNVAFKHSMWAKPTKATLLEALLRFQSRAVLALPTNLPLAEYKRLDAIPPPSGKMLEVINNGVLPDKYLTLNIYAWPNRGWLPERPLWAGGVGVRTPYDMFKLLIASSVWLEPELVEARITVGNWADHTPEQVYVGETVWAGEQPDDASAKVGAPFLPVGPGSMEPLRLPQVREAWRRYGLAPQRGKADVQVGGAE